MIKPRPPVPIGRVLIPIPRGRTLGAGCIGPTLLLLFGLAGCGPGGSGQSDVPPFSRTDSAGVLISVTKGAVARARLGWEIDSVPDVVIGAGGNKTDYLYRVQGLKGLPGGGLLLVNGGSQEMWFFDSRGRFLRSVGGDGEGPGEFRDPVLVTMFGTDSLLFFDKRLPRFQLFSGDGRYARGFRHPDGWPNGRRPPVGALPSHRMLLEDRRFVGGEAAIREMGRFRVAFMFFWYDPVAGGKEMIDSVVVEATYRDRMGGWDIPFASRPSATIGGGGAFITRGYASEIREYDAEAKVHRIFRVDEAGRPVTRELTEAMVDLEQARVPRVSRSTWERIYGEMRIPDTLPVFEALLFDDLGWLWAELYEWNPARPREWMVFDTQGRAHGVIQVPLGLQVEWIGRDFILGVWKDELQVEYVHRHPLRRRPATGGVRERK